MTAAFIVAGLEIAALGIVFWHAICACNHMSAATPRAIVVAVALVFASSATRAFLVAIGEAEPGVIQAAFAWGIAIGMVANRRREIACPCLPSWPHVGKPDKEIHA